MLTQALRAVRNTGWILGSETICRDLFAKAGITVDGSAPHDIQVHDTRLYDRLLRDGPQGLGEAYMDGWWDARSLDEMLTRVLRSRLDLQVRENWTVLAHAAKARLLNRQSQRRAFEVGQRHYDIGNDLYRAMLDKRLVYTCGYWRDAADLDQAQEAKLDLVCRKIGLHEGVRVLELGCGWGSFARYAAEKYGAHVTGLTVSKEQVALARELCQGLPVDIQLADYRDARGTFDAVVSIGIMEHVGYRNYRTYMELARRCLKPDGIAFVHTIAGNYSKKSVDPWFDRYIFPNSMLPSATQLGAAMEDLFVLEDLHNIGPHYDRTLMAWDANFEQAWPTLRATYGDRFYRMWKYYLLGSAAGFRSRQLQLYQLVMTPIGRAQPECRLN